MTVYSRYFYRQFSLAFIAVAMIISGIVMVNFFDHLLEDIASGLIDQRFILPLLGSGYLRYLGVGLASAACLGGAYTLVQMIQRNEITVWQASGEGYPNFLSKLLWLGIGLSLIAAVFQLWLLPLNERYYADQYLQAQQSAESRLLVSEQFTNLPGMGDMYVENFDSNTTKFQNSFLVTQDNIRNNTRLTTAKSGNLESTSEALIMHKSDGQNLLIDGNNIIETLDFETLDFTYPRKHNSLSSRSSDQQTSTFNLINNFDDYSSQLTLGSRISQIIFVFANTLLAGLLFFHKPRRSQLALIFAVISIHLFYRYLTELSLTWPIENFGISPVFILQLPHLLFIFLVLIYWRYRSIRW